MEGGPQPRGGWPLQPQVAPGSLLGWRRGSLGPPSFAARGLEQGRWLSIFVWAHETGQGRLTLLGPPVLLGAPAAFQWFAVIKYI